MNIYNNSMFNWLKEKNKVIIHKDIEKMGATIHNASTFNFYLHRQTRDNFWVLVMILILFLVLIIKRLIWFSS